ncbi:MAG: hypothetical protein ACTSRZ_16580 [Promethearchaeota archaeon]
MNQQNKDGKDEKNPYNICIWKNEEVCKDCELKSQLHCHRSLKISIIFGISWLLGVIPAIAGIVVGNLEFAPKITYVLLWIAYSLFFFLVWGPPILCAHCPYYAEGGSKILHCSINGGFPKTTKFNPKPASKSEKIQFSIGALILLLFPLPLLFIMQTYILFILSALGDVIGIIIVKKKICSICINFSCILNNVPEEKKHAFIEKNEILKKFYI